MDNDSSSLLGVIFYFIVVIRTFIERVTSLPSPELRALYVSLHLLDTRCCLPVCRGEIQSGDSPAQEHTSGETWGEGALCLVAVLLDTLCGEGNCTGASLGACMGVCKCACTHAQVRA